MKEVYKLYCRYSDVGKLTCSITSSLYCTYLPVALVVFAIHTISFICDSMMSKRQEGYRRSTYDI